MAANLEEGEVVSIEIGPDNAQATAENQARAGVADRCTVIEGDALQRIGDLQGPFDMLFIDAEKEDYLRYLELAEPLLTADAIVVADNVKRFAADLQPYLDYVRGSGRYESAYHDFEDDGLEVSVRKG